MLILFLTFNCFVEKYDPNKNLKMKNIDKKLNKLKIKKNANNNSITIAIIITQWAVVQATNTATNNKHRHINHHITITRHQAIITTRRRRRINAHEQPTQALN